MKMIHILDLSRNDALTAEAMKTTRGGYFARRLTDATHAAPSGETGSAGDSLSFVNSATSAAIRSLGSALETVARKG